jgi:hypothetical protein
MTFDVYAGCFTQEMDGRCASGSKAAKSVAPLPARPPAPEPSAPHMTVVEIHTRHKRFVGQQKPVSRQHRKLKHAHTRTARERGPTRLLNI